MKDLFRSLDTDNTGSVSKVKFISVLKDAGILETDLRISKLMEKIEQHPTQEIDFYSFKEIIKNSIAIVEKALTGNFIIPDFTDFCDEINKIYTKTKKIKAGKVADYIPQLQRINPDKYGIAVCTIDGQSSAWGDFDENFVIQSICKPINYCLVLEELGEDLVHKHVGREPSGVEFNALSLNNNGLPHNPMINSGAIMCCSMLKQDLNQAGRFDYVLEKWRQLSGNGNIQFNNSVYLSEKETAARNFALGYFMKEKGSFPENINLTETLDFYFQCCSIELNCRSLAKVGATFANGGVNPLTGKRNVSDSTVKDCLSLMYSCGMYDFSGEFAFTIGLPSKSGVSGAMLIIIPNVMGIALWSPPLDPLGNSVKGLEFCKELVKKYNFHNYDNLTIHSNKIDPRKHKLDNKLEGVIAACWAASYGDLDEMRKLIAGGLDIDDENYDGRTPLHLAASSGHVNIVKFLISHKVKINPIDRWNGTPLDDANKSRHHEVVKLLKQAGAKTGKELNK